MLPDVLINLPRTPAGWITGWSSRIEMILAELFTPSPGASGRSRVPPFRDAFGRIHGGGLIEPTIFTTGLQGSDTPQISNKT
jgi:hypothetical protein